MAMRLLRASTAFGSLACVAACGLSGATLRAPAAVDSGASLAGRLTVQSGCEETFVARDPKSTAVLAVQVPGILERSRGAGLPYREKLRLGGHEVVVRLEQGADLDHWCTDVMARPPRIEATWAGVSGTATVELVARSTGSSSGAGGARTAPTSAVVRLRRVILAREGRPDETLTLPGLEIRANLGVPGGG